MANYYQYMLKAGVELQASVPGKLIVVDSVTGATGVDITPMFNNSNGRTMPGRKKGFKCWTDFDAVILKAATDCTVALFLSSSDVSLGFTDGSSVNVAGSVSITNDGASRVPVDLAGGNVSVTATNVGISNTDANPVPVRSAALANLIHANPVAIGIGAGQAVISDNTLRRLRIRNASTNGALIALGGAGVTLANAVIVLEPGQVWAEDDAAGAAWYATSDRAGGSVAAMGVK